MFYQPTWRLVAIKFFELFDGPSAQLWYRESLNTKSKDNPFRTDKRTTGHDAISNSLKLASEKLSDAIETRGLPGVTICVSRKGHMIWNEAFGFCDLENELKCLPEAKMRIASVSKSIFAATIIGKMIEQKQLDINSSVHEYLSPGEFPKQKYRGKEYDITIKQLLSHTSGIRHYPERTGLAARPIGSKGSKRVQQCDCQYNREEQYQRNTFRSAIDALVLFRAGPLESEPGKFNYTTYGFTLLSAVAERALQKAQKRDGPKESSVSLMEVLGTFFKPQAEGRSSKSSDGGPTESSNGHLAGTSQQNLVWNFWMTVLQAVSKLRGERESKDSEQIEDIWMKVLHSDWNMTETSLDQDEPILYNRARYYVTEGSEGGPINAPYVDSSYKWAGGGLISTAADLVKFGTALVDSYKSRDGAKLKKSTLDLLWTEVKESYCLGFNTKELAPEESGGEKRAIYHTGTAIGASSILVIYPDSEIVVAILCNLGDISLTRIGFEITNIFARET